jgi:hypothetical protein
MGEHVTAPQREKRVRERKVENTIAVSAEVGKGGRIQTRGGFIHYYFISTLLNKRRKIFFIAD